MTKRILALFVFFLALGPSLRAQTVVVSGNLVDLGVNNVTASNSYVQFCLQNFGSNIPRVIGSNVIVSACAPNFIPNGSGVIGGNIQSNDSISPTSTFYKVCVFNLGSQFRCFNFLINYAASHTFNLNTATPITVTPMPALPPNPVVTNPPGSSSQTISGPIVVTGFTTSAVTNGAGLQFFTTSTTCTTAGSVGAVCTTAAITLPVPYADTNYRVACTGQGPTNVPVVETYAKSNTTFTITIAALTAAAATFSSYDCVAGHN